MSRLPSLDTHGSARGSPDCSNSSVRRQSGRRRSKRLKKIPRHGMPPSIERIAGESTDIGRLRASFNVNDRRWCETTPASPPHNRPDRTPDFCGPVKIGESSGGIDVREPLYSGLSTSDKIAFKAPAPSDTTRRFAGCLLPGRFAVRISTTAGLSRCRRWNAEYRPDGGRRIAALSRCQEPC